MRDLRTDEAWEQWGRTQMFPCRFGEARSLLPERGVDEVLVRGFTHDAERSFQVHAAIPEDAARPGQSEAVGPT